VSIADSTSRQRMLLSWIGVFIIAGLVVVALLGVPVADLVTIGALERTLRGATPIALAAIGGLYAEKSGVFNIGLEGFLIFGAFVASVVAWFLGSGGTITQTHLWLGVLAAVVVCSLLAFFFAVLTVRYKANQIVAGLAVWFIALGFAPFVATVIWNDVSSPPFSRISDVVVPGLSNVPIVGPILFAASPLVLLTIVITVIAWIVLYRTRFGYWVQAAGENPKALDTAGVSVNRVRYAAVVLSGALSGLGGAALSVGFAGGFIGNGATMVNGRGWIAITAYLFGNYNPLGAFGASFLFGGMDALQVQLQTVGIALPQSLTNLIPYVGVLVVLVLVGHTRLPAAAGEPYDTEE
jgi:ABC-type uncharacterized transport system permease subunit